MLVTPAIAITNGDVNGSLATAPTTKDTWSLRFYNVSYTIRQCKVKVKILNDTCGAFHSGRLTAILGPSGAGKTTMMNVLAGFKANGVCGHFELNGVERKLSEFRKISSYIPQDFAMLDLLTVYEAIKVSADLKLPSEVTNTEKQKIMTDILHTLNMEKCHNTLTKNLSSGERKRLSIAIELVTNPPVMFFDEPTSGLDSVASLQVINFLRHLACDGRIIVCVVHQPSSKLMKLFDDVIVMSRGEILYSGQQKHMISHFENEGFICPNYYNPADFVLEIGSKPHDDPIIALIQRNKNVAHRKREEFVDESTLMLLRTSLTSIKIDEPSDDDKSKHFCRLSSIRPKSQASISVQLSVLIKRSLLTMSRNLLAVQMRFIMHILIGILLGIVFHNVGNDASKVLTNLSCIFFLVMFVFFGNAMPSVLLCPKDTAVFIREYLNGWYSLNAYYVSKIIADIPMQLACPTVLIAIAYYMTDQPPDWWRFFLCWAITLLTAILGHFIGLVFGSTFQMQMAIFLVPGITIPIMIFSGFFIRIHELPPFLRPLSDISFFRYIMEGFMQALYNYDREDLQCLGGFCYYESPQVFLKYLDMDGDRFSVDVVAVLVWIVVLKLLFLLSLLLSIRKAL